MEKYIEHIESYLNGTISDSDKRDFEQELTRNTELQKVLDGFPLAKNAVIAGVEEDAYQAVLLARSKMKGDEKRSPRGVKIYLQIAAGIIALALVIGVSYSNLYLTIPKIVHSSYSPPSDLTKFMGPETEDKASILREIQERGDLNEAIALVSEWSAENPEDLGLTRSLAHLYFQAEKYNEAEGLFRELLNDRRFNDDAEFHIALCQYMLGNDNIAKEKLTAIAESPSHPYRNKAKEALSKLESFWRFLVF